MAVAKLYCLVQKSAGNDVCAAGIAEPCEVEQFEVTVNNRACIFVEISVLEQEAKLFVTRWIIRQCEVVMQLNIGIIMPTTFYGNMRHKSLCSLIVYGRVMILYFVQIPLEVHNEYLWMQGFKIYCNF